jgi:urease accessory protein
MGELTGNSVSGHLLLRCEVRLDGTPYLAEQDFRAPVHLSKAHLSDDGESLLVTVVNPTAGFFDGDKLVMDVAVGKGARLVMSTPSSSRVFRTRSGDSAVCEQRFRVEDGGFLEWMPEPFIPHAGASYVQQTEIELQDGAGLFFVDWISPGRVAKGESFEYDSLRWELDLSVSGRLSARERYTMEKGGPEGITAMFSEGHYISIYLAGEMVEKFPESLIPSLCDADTYIGIGGLERGVMVVRALCRDSLSARKVVGEIRNALYTAIEKKPPNLGRIFI